MVFLSRLLPKLFAYFIFIVFRIAESGIICVSNTLILVVQSWHYACLLNTYHFSMKKKKIYFRILEKEKMIMHLYKQRVKTKNLTVFCHFHQKPGASEEPGYLRQRISCRREILSTRAFLWQFSSEYLGRAIEGRSNLDPGRAYS